MASCISADDVNFSELMASCGSADGVNFSGLMASCGSADGVNFSGLMASCGSANGVNCSGLELQLEFAREKRKLDIEEILCEVENLKKEIEKDKETQIGTETETKKRELKIKKMLRQVKKLCKEESVKTHEYFDLKPTELRITKKATRIYMFGLPMAKLMYDRNSTCYNDPTAVQHFEVYVQIAINAYNETHSTKYKLVEVVKAYRSLPVKYIYSLYFTFTAKLDDDDDVADAKTFQAGIGFGMDEGTVLFVE